MVSEFVRVKDPARTGAGDLLLLPASARGLNVGVKTLAKLGISIGDTCRSDNAGGLVDMWMAGSPARPRSRLFVVASVVKCAGPDEDDSRFLGLDATVRTAETEGPKIYRATLVPFSPTAPRWSFGQWAKCWDIATGGAVSRRLAELCGAGNALPELPSCTALEADRRFADAFASLVWDEVGGEREEPLVSHSDMWFPTIRPGREPGKTTYLLPSLAEWNVNSKCERISLPVAALAGLVARGALVLRPSARFRSRVTDWCASWCAGQIAGRYESRAAKSGKFLDGLRVAIAADRGRARSVGRVSAKTGREAARVQASVDRLLETGVAG